MYKRQDLPDGIDLQQVDVLLDPQTSGGLLIALSQSRAEELLKKCSTAAIIGKLSDSGTPGTEAGRIRLC